MKKKILLGLALLSGLMFAVAIIYSIVLSELYSSPIVDLFGMEIYARTFALCLGIVGVITFVASITVLGDMNKDAMAEDRYQKAVAEAQAQARTFLGKTWRVASANLSRDNGYWYVILCLYGANGVRKLMRVGDGHYSVNTFFYLRADDKVTFVLAGHDQAEEDNLDASSFLVPTVVAIDIESVVAEEPTA